jgi:hypothetical protein
MTEPQIAELARLVQHNCHISDARHGADYSLCVYLMKMREYYRWEYRLPFGVPLQKDQVGGWLERRETLWEDLEDAVFAPIVIDGDAFDPYDTDDINARLVPQGLVYSGGLGHQGKPHFVLGDLEQQRRHGDCAIYVVAAEHARDLTAPPAMTCGETIFLRRESLRRLLWEKLESWRWSRPDNALGRAFACYDFEGALDTSLDAMTDREGAAVLLHEQGEHEVGRRLGEAWNRMLFDLIQTPAEVMARAVRDHLADCLVTLPALAESGDAASLHFYVGNLSHMRRALFPALEVAYETWRSGGGTGHLAAVAADGRDHWETLARAMLALHAEHGPAAAGPIRDLVEHSHDGLPVIGSICPRPPPLGQ